MNQPDSPSILNKTDYSILVFQERGVFFNKQILHPGESVSIKYKESGGLLPYHIHAVIGDESCFPGKTKSIKNLVSVAAVPVAFAGGALATAMSGGAINKASIIAGTALAKKASTIANALKEKKEKYPENFTGKSGLIIGGRRYIVIKGGFSQPLNIKEVSKKKYKKNEVKSMKFISSEDPQYTCVTGTNVM